MIVINLFGAPGAGKSTGAAYVFSQLKLNKINAELVTEFAKDKVWEESKAVFKDQLYIFAKQNFKMSRCKDKVDVIITDSPLLLSLFYDNDKDEKLGSLILSKFQEYNNLNYYINRVKDYNPKGRFQNEAESDIISTQLKNLLSQHIDYMEIDGDSLGYDTVVTDILAKLKK